MNGLVEMPQYPYCSLETSLTCRGGVCLVVGRMKMNSYVTGTSVVVYHLLIEVPHWTDGLSAEGTHWLSAGGPLDR